MDDRAPADLANVLFIAAGLGLAFACAYLVRRPGDRSLRVWAGAALVAVPGLLLGVAMTQPQMGMRAAYRGLTRVLSEPLTFEARIVAVARPKVSGGSPDEGGPQGVPGLSPSADAPEGSVTARDGVSQDPAPSSSPAPPPVSPAPTVATTPPPTESPSPSATETTTPPTPTEITPPPPSPSVVTEP